MFVVCNICHACTDMLCTLGKEDSLSEGSKPASLKHLRSYKMFNMLQTTVERLMRRGEARRTPCVVHSTAAGTVVTQVREAVIEVGLETVRLGRSELSQEILRRQSKGNLMTAQRK